MCEDCKYCENDPNKRPCSCCIVWSDGYLEYREYVNKYLDKLQEVE